MLLSNDEDEYWFSEQLVLGCVVPDNSQPEDNLDKLKSVSEAAKLAYRTPKAKRFGFL